MKPINGRNCDCGQTATRREGGGVTCERCRDLTNQWNAALERDRAWFRDKHRPSKFEPIAWPSFGAVWQ